MGFYLAKKSFSCLAFFLLFLVGCGRETINVRTDTEKAPSLMESENLDPLIEVSSEQRAPAPSPPPAPVAEEMEPSLAAFNEHLYPLLKENCQGCHETAVQPFFASLDVKASYEALINTGKLNAKVPALSRVYQRLHKEFHQCWDNCESDSALLLSAIKLWALTVELSEEDLIQKTAPLVPAMQTETTTSKGNTAASAYATDYLAIEPPMAAYSDDPDGSATSYLSAPDTGAGAFGPEAPMGSVSYEVMVPEAGEYAFWGRVKGLDDSQNSFYISINDGPFILWDLPVSSGQWQWDRVLNMGENSLFTLPSGIARIEIKRREEGARFNSFAFSKKTQDFEGIIPSRRFHILSYDLSPLTGKEAILIVHVAPFAKDSTVMLIGQLRIETKEPLLVKDIRPLINGVFDPANSSFRAIDKNIAIGSEVLSSAAILLAGQKGFDLDELSFAFSVLE